MGGLLPEGLPPEERLLLWCARIDGGGEPPAIDAIDSDRFLGLAGRHALVPAAFRSLVELRPEALPHLAAEALKSSYRRSVRRSFLLVARMVKVLDVLEGASIPAIVFKGPAQALCLEWGPGARQFVDLDLLVRKKDARRARDLLVGAGHRWDRDLPPRLEKLHLRTKCEFTLLDPEAGGTVELHWDFFPRHFSVEFPLDEIRRRAGTAEIAGRSVRVLSPGDDLLFSCVHGAKHHWERLGWLRDLAGSLRFRPPRDWPRVEAQATHLGVSRILASALHLARKLLGTETPGTLRPDRGARDYAQRVARVLFSEPGRSHAVLGPTRLHVLARERAADRARLLRRLTLTTTRRDWESFPLSERILGLCPLWRPIRLLGETIFGPRIAGERKC